MPCDSNSRVIKVAYLDLDKKWLSKDYAGGGGECGASGRDRGGASRGSKTKHRTNEDAKPCRDLIATRPYASPTRARVGRSVKWSLDSIRSINCRYPHPTIPCKGGAGVRVGAWAKVGCEFLSHCLIVPRSQYARLKPYLKRFERESVPADPSGKCRFRSLPSPIP